MNAVERLDAMLHAHARRQASHLRTRSFQRAVAMRMLEPTATDWDLQLAECRFLPYPLWPASWTEEARRAYFGLR